MKKIVLIVAALALTSCGSIDMSGVKEKLNKFGKNPCYNTETKAVDIGCKK